MTSLQVAPRKKMYWPGRKLPVCPRNCKLCGATLKSAAVDFTSRVTGTAKVEEAVPAARTRKTNRAEYFPIAGKRPMNTRNRPGVVTVRAPTSSHPGGSVLADPPSIPTSTTIDSEPEATWIVCEKATLASLKLSCVGETWMAALGVWARLTPAQINAAIKTAGRFLLGIAVLSQPEAEWGKQRSAYLMAIVPGVLVAPAVEMTSGTASPGATPLGIRKLI